MDTGPTRSNVNSQKFRAYPSMRKPTTEMAAPMTMSPRAP